MIDGFEFVADGKKYVSTIEERRGSKGEFWWWFTVSGDASSYAPFQASKSDTKKSVQERMVAFYRNRCARLAEPTVRGGRWARKPDAAAAPKPMPSPDSVS